MSRTGYTFANGNEQSGQSGLRDRTQRPLWSKVVCVDGQKRDVYDVVKSDYQQMAEDLHARLVWRSARPSPRLYPGDAMRRSGLVLLLAAILAVTLGGCGRYYWTKAGSTAEHFERDSRECVQEAKRTPPGPVSGLAADVIEKRYRACLAGRGYVREKQFDPPAAGSYRGIESEEELAAGAPSKP